MHAPFRLVSVFALSLSGAAQAQNYHVVPPPVQAGGMGGYGPRMSAPGQPMPPGSGYGGYGGGYGAGYGGGYGGYPGGGYGAGYGGGYGAGYGAGAGGQGANGANGSAYGCIGCSYIGDYNPNAGNPPVKPMAPPKRIQGEWRNGQWYY